MIKNGKACANSSEPAIFPKSLIYLNKPQTDTADHTSSSVPTELMASYPISRHRNQNFTKAESNTIISQFCSVRLKASKTYCCLISAFLFCHSLSNEPSASPCQNQNVKSEPAIC